GSTQCRPAHRPDGARLDSGRGSLCDRHRGLARPRHGISRPGVPPAEADGYALGSGLGILVALLFAAWRPLAGAFMPYAVAANAIPIIAFAPIMNNWFGLLNPFSKMAIAAVLCFFPVMINTLRGLTSVHPSSIE